MQRTCFFIGDSLCALRSYDLIRAVNLLRKEFNASDITLLSYGKASVYARITEILDDTLKTEFKDEVKVSDIVTDKYYDNYNIAGMLMPELALYLKDI